MSIVAVRIYDDEIIIAADSITVRGGGTQSKGGETKFVKLFDMNGMIIGGVGWCEELSLMQLFAQTTKPSRADSLGILDFMAQFSSWKNNKITKPDIDNDYIIVFDRRVFSVNGWFVNEVTGYEAIGAGEDYALAAMYLGHDPKEAVEVACELSIYCEKPIIEYKVRKRDLK